MTPDNAAGRGTPVRVAEADAVFKLRALISYDVKQSDLAAKFGVSRSFMSAVLAGKKAPTNAMLAAVGMRRAQIIEAIPAKGSQHDPR